MLIPKIKGYKRPNIASGQKLFGFINTERYESSKNNTARIFNFISMLERRLFNTD
jgi:hypothetical protein